MKVAVIGAGLGGLTAALALARQGCRVELIERSPLLSEAGAGVQLSPNATRVLRSLGLLERIEAEAVKVGRVRIRRSSDGHEIAQVPLGAVAEGRYGAPFLVAHRADVQAILLAAIRSESGVMLRLGERLVAYEASDGDVRLTVQGATERRTLRADGLVGADGLRSAVRARLVEDRGDQPRFSGRLAWRSLVPAGDAPEEARQAVSNLWLGPKAHLVHYPVRGGALINVVAILGSTGPREAAIDGWSVPGDPDRIRAAFRRWSPAARRLIEAAPDWRVWPLFERPALKRWSDGPVTLVGDAAHPMLPFLAQGAAQAIQDGGALAAAVGAASDFAGGAAAFERVRRPLATRVQRESRRQDTLYHLAGPLAAGRDAVLKWLGPDRMLARYDWLYGAADIP